VLFTKSLSSESYQLSLLSQIFFNNELWKKLNLYSFTDEKQVLFQEKVANTSLVLYIHSNMCTPCVEREIENFLVLTKTKEIKLNNPLVIIAGYKKEVINKSPTFSSILSYVYYIPKNKESNEFEKLSKPCMVLFKSGYPKLVYLSSGAQNAYFEVWKSFLLKSGI
jgi:hypothetical protein